MSKQISEIEQFIIEFSKRIENFGFSGQIVLRKGGEVIYSAAQGKQRYGENPVEMNEQSALSIGSISKQFTAALILKERDRGKLTLTDSISEFIDVPEDKTKITIHHLLCHSSGIQDLVDDFDYIPTDEFLKGVLAKPLKFEPGSEFSYSNTGFSLLAIILERINNTSYQEQLLGALAENGIKSVGWFGDQRWNEKNSVNYYIDGEWTGSISTWVGSHDKPYWGILGNGGVCMSAIDLSKWMDVLFSGRFISKDSLKHMTTPHMEDYGYGWDILETDLGKMITHDGGSTLGVNADAMYFPDLELSIVILSNVVIGGMGMSFQLRDALRTIFETKNFLLPPEVTSPPLPAKEAIEREGLQLSPVNDGYILTIEGQKALNMVFAPDLETSRNFDRMNERVNLLGEYLVDKNWEDFFKNYSTREVTEERLTFYKELLADFEKEIGTIKSALSAGSLPFPNYHAMTLLSLGGEKKRGGIPIIWKDATTILGIRPMNTNYPFSCFATRIAEKTFVAFSLMYLRGFELKILDDSFAIATLL